MARAATVKARVAFTCRSGLGDWPSRRGNRDTGMMVAEKKEFYTYFSYKPLTHLCPLSFYPHVQVKNIHHGRTHPPQQEDCRQEANQEVRPASVGPVHPHPQLLLEEAQGY